MFAGPFLNQVNREVLFMRRDDVAQRYAEGLG
jgi:hypothetical protein